MYFKRSDTGTVIPLTSVALSSSQQELVMDDQSLAAPCGQLGISQVGPDGAESAPTYTDFSMIGSTEGLEPIGPICDPDPPPPGSNPLVRYGFANEFHHRDHLGSLRVVTEAAGSAAETYDYYPYGRQMVPDGGDELGTTRGRFTGHERDGYVGQDYMFARFKLANEAAFATPDPILDVSWSHPTSWNRYSYVRDSPASSVDRFGTQVGEPTMVAPDGLTYDDFGILYSSAAIDWYATAWENPWITRVENSSVRITRTPRQIESSSYFSVGLYAVIEKILTTVWDYRVEIEEPRLITSAPILPQGPAGAPSHVPQRTYYEGVIECYAGNRFASWFPEGSGIQRVAEFVEIGSPVVFGLDIYATSAKMARMPPGGLMGTTNPSASGVGMVLRNGAKGLPAGGTRNAAVLGARMFSKSLANTALSVVSAFTASYNTTVSVQCVLGIIQ